MADAYTLKTPAEAGKTSPVIRWFQKVMTSAEFGTLGVIERNHILFLNAVSWFGVVFMLIFSAIAFSRGRVSLGSSTLIASTVVVGMLLATRHFHSYRLAGWAITSIMASLFGYLVWSGGEQGSGILWIQAFPLIAMFLISTMAGTIISFLFLGFVGLVLFVPAFNIAGFSTDYAYRVMGTYLYVWLFGLIYDLIRRYTQRHLQEANAALSRATEALTFEKQQTDGILKNVKEGIFLLDKDLRISSTHSSELSGIFESGVLGGQSFLDILKPLIAERDLNAVRDWLPMLFESKVNPLLLAEINPLAEVRMEFSSQPGNVREKHVRFGFTPVSLNAETSILVVVRDATDEVNLQRRLDTEAVRHQQSMEKLFQIIHVDPVMMGEFIRDTEAELDSINALLRDRSLAPASIMPKMYQSVHGIKGNALLLGMNELARKVHDIESQIKPFLELPCSWKDLLGLTLGLGAIQAELEEIAELIAKIVGFQNSSGASGLAEKGLLERSMSRLVEREAVRLGKQTRLHFEGFDSRILPEKYRKLAKDALVQLVRNSLVHGIETPADRQKAGKPSEGMITLIMSLQPGFLRLACRDDGRGLDLMAIRNRALESGDAQAARARELKPGELAMMIFENGFSTADEEDLSAGRGAGLALVKNRIEEEGGKVFLRTKPGVYCEIGFQLPVELT